MEELYKIYLSCGGRVTTDSRTIRGGELFFALRGENFDGNDYALKALEAGAAYAVVNEDVQFPEQVPEPAEGQVPEPAEGQFPEPAEGQFPEPTEGMVPEPAEGRLIRVPDPFTALRDLAVWHRTHVRGGALPVIGLTGTNGKTTTKNLIAAVLAKKYRVTATQGNLNNDIGVPLSLLSITPDTEIAVIEMGANHPDDIAKLVRVSRPDYGLITNVGRAHLLGFGSFEGVKAAKGELYKWLGAQRGSLIFLNEDDADLREMAAREACHVFGYGIKYQGVEILPATPDEPFLRLKLGEDVIRTQLVGAYNATNVLAAIAVGNYFGVPRADAIAAVEGFVPSNNRSQMTRTASNTLIVDAYNANPSSMRAALENFALVQADRKLALLGDMRELGEESVAEHVKVLEQLRAAGLPACLVGDEFKKALEAVGTVDTVAAVDACPSSACQPEPSSCHPERSEGSPASWFPDSAALADWLAANPVRDTVILIKGSRGIQMEKVLDRL